ncbi:MAG: outer membrane protein assembly factor BamD (BamD/ComL family) [Planctomycetota bacterium]|jgi:outer membrane protein assembly factor BamD (BamD/ComL family)
MNGRRFACLSLGIMLAGTACTTTSQPLQSAPQLITAAEQQLDAEAFDQALATLEPIVGLQCPKRLRDQRDLITAQALFGLGQPWQAFLELEEFSSLYPHSDLRSRAVDIIWNTGKLLVESDGGFLFFWSDKRAGRTVLEHLVTRHPDTQRLADALRILGDMAFDNANYELAQERYRDIINSRPDSDWRFYAQFRLAMSLVASLRGADYDLNRMELAAAHLREFLISKPEGPKMVEAATKALVMVKQWQVQRHLDIADFYQTLKSIEGQRYHLQLATRSEFDKVPGYEQAVERRQAFSAANPVSAAGTDTPTPTGGRP